MKTPNGKLLSTFKHPLFISGMILLIIDVVFNGINLSFASGVMMATAYWSP
jgi:hypothetical protein